MINEEYQFHNLLSYRTLAHGISSKKFGSMKKNESDVDREKLATFAKSVGITDEIVCMRQIHSGNVRIVSNASDLRIPETDALITNKKHVPLAVMTADCLPLVFYDPKNEVMGVAHAGYKGLLNDVIAHTIQRFIADFSSDPQDIIVGIGPAIEMMCYEVNEERIAAFDKAFPTCKNSSAQIGGKYFLNLQEVAQQCLIKEGILKEHIEIKNICTKCDKNFFSYRRGDTFERFISVVSLV